MVQLDVLTKSNIRDQTSLNSFTTQVARVSAEQETICCELLCGHPLFEGIERQTKSTKFIRQYLLHRLRQWVIIQKIPHGTRVYSELSRLGQQNFTQCIHEITEGSTRNFTIQSFAVGFVQISVVLSVFLEQIQFFGFL